MRIRLRPARFALALCASACLALLAASPAAALLTRQHLGDFGPDGTASTSFDVYLTSVALDRSSNRLYVLAGTSGVAASLYGFDVSTAGTQAPLGGSFPLSGPFAGSGGGSATPGMVVDNTGLGSAGHIVYVAAQVKTIPAFDSSGAALGGNFPINPAAPKTLCGTPGIDSAGDIWVPDTSLLALRHYDSAGNPLGTLDVSAQGGPCGVAFDSADDMYVLSGGEIWKYTAASSYSDGHQIVSRAGFNFGIDGIGLDAADHLYALDGSVIVVYDKEGDELYRFGNIPAAHSYDGSGTSIAIDPASGYAYVPDIESGVRKVRVFGPPVVLPDPVSGAATAITHTTAIIAGSVDPAGGPDVSGCFVEYGTTAAYGSTAPCSPSTPYSAPTDVSASLGGLAAGVTYHYRVKATNANGDNFSADATFTTLPAVSATTTGAADGITRTTATLHGSLDPDGLATDYYFQYGKTTSYGNSTASTSAGSGSGDTPVLEGISGLTAQTTYHYRLAATNIFGTTFGADKTFQTSDAVKDAQTDPATAITLTAATLNGSLDPEGFATTYHFEYGPTTSYGTSTATVNAGSDPGATPVSTGIASLTPGTVYHFRLVATNSFGTTMGSDETFRASTGPAITNVAPSDVLSDTAAISFDLNPNAADTAYHVEFGLADCLVTSCAGTSEVGSLPGVTPDRVAVLDPQTLTSAIHGLEPDTTYHYRVIATNARGTAVSVDQTLHTYSRTEHIEDPCPNALARQQTGAAVLLDCRAYELVSAPNTGGYDVESSTISGGQPFAGYPSAKDKALYAVHNGGVPGVSGDPTNNGPDPYLARRDEANQRWDTSYVGIPSTASPDPFASTLLAADAGLDTFAFGGPDLCDPCFGDGSSGIPLRKPDGSLVQGMAGPLAVADPTPSGSVKEPLSADGEHLIFASTQAFVPGANDNGTDVTIYDRNLKTGLTQIVSTDPGSGVLADGQNVVELGVSADGERILIGDKLGTDAAGNDLYHLYLHVGADPDSIDLMPGAGQGALYAGMDSGGTMAYLASREALTGDDTDTSVDLYRATVGVGTASLERVSADPSAGAGGIGDSDVCDPVGNSQNIDGWNTAPGGTPDCSVVAIGGGGGVATESGVVYFLSPEDLDGNGTPGAPNLYRAAPGGDPHYVTTLESELTGPQPRLTTYAEEPGFGFFFTGAGVAVDRQSGAVYGFDASFARLSKFNAAGNSSNFSCGGCAAAGSSSLTGADTPAGSFAPNLSTPVGMAVDSAGKLYVPDYGHNVVDVFNADGSYDSQMAVTAPSAVAIDPSTGDVYVASKTTNKVVVFPAGGGASTNFSVILGPTGVAVGPGGEVYVVNGSQAAKYDSAGNFSVVLDPNKSYGVAVDPDTGNVLVDEKVQIAQFDSAGKPTGGADGAGAPFGGDTLTKSLGVGLNADGDVYAINGNKIIPFRLALFPDPRVDSPLVIDGLTEAGTRHPEEFQSTPSGEDAAFGAAIGLDGSGFETHGRAEVYRYDAGADEVRCASCNSTRQRPRGDAALPANGLGITDDGRVFFDSYDALVARDLNQRQDVYEWNGEKTALISNGLGSADSTLLTVTHDGTDAFFFTRETLAAQDENGPHMKLYDAREGGGFFAVPPPALCAASDECHGPGTQAARPPSIGTLAGTPGNFRAPVEAKRCPKGKRKVKSHDKVRCVKRKRHAKRHREHRRGNGKRHPGKPGKAGRR